MRTFATMMIVLLLSAVTSCAGKSGNAITPDLQPTNHQSSITSHQCWGIWQFTWTGTTFEIVPIRQAQTHYNVVSLLEPGDGSTKVTIESDIVPSGPNSNIITLDIGLTHPFSGLTQYTGFDVKGIFFGEEDDWTNVVSLPEELLTTRLNETIWTVTPTLLNADGWTDLWNPYEYNNNGEPEILSYVNGILGTPYSMGNFRATANPYKLFADELTPTGNIPQNRLYFGAGDKWIRRYVIDFVDNVWSNPVVFNYAVDACWNPPNHIPPTSVPGDFPDEANQAEPVIRDLEISNITLTTMGGSVDITVSAFDHQGGALTCEIIAPAIISGRIELSPSGDGEWSDTIFNYLGGKVGQTPLWVVMTDSDSEENEAFTRIFVSVNVGSSTWLSHPKILVGISDELSDPCCIYDSSEELHVLCVKNNDPADDQFIYWRSGEGIPHTLDISPVGTDMRDPDIIPYGSDLLVVFRADPGIYTQIYYATLDPTAPGSTLNATQIVTTGAAWRPKLAQSSSETRFIWSDGRSGLDDIYGETYPLLGEVCIADIGGYNCKWPDFTSNSIDFYLAFYGLTPDQTNNRVYFQDFSDPEIILVEGNKAGIPYLGCTNTHICAAWGPYFQEWKIIGSGPIPYPQDGCYQVLLDDGQAAKMFYDKYGNGMVFYTRSNPLPGVSTFALAYLPSATNPVLPVGDITDYKDWVGLDIAICDNEVALVYIDPNGDLVYRTASL